MTARKTSVKASQPKTKKSNPVVNKLEQISSTTPIPFEGNRGFSYVTNEEYLPFLDTDDNYAQLLLQSRLLSCTHNACVITKKDYCAGAGFQTNNEADIQDAKFNEWIKSLNLKNENSIEINKQALESLFTYGNTPIEIVRFSVGNKRHLFIYVHNFQEWRLGVPNEDGISTYAIKSKLFTKTGIVFTKEDYDSAKVLPIYNPRNKNRAYGTKYKEGYNWVRDSTGSERTLIWYKNSVTGFDNYGLPSAISALIYEILEYKGARFNLDNFDNNMVVSAILALKGSSTQDEINKIGRNILSKHTGDGKRGRVMVVGSEAGIDGSDLHNLDTHKEGSYKDSDELWSQKIILANQWDAILAGIISASTMGKGSGFLAKILEIKKNTVIIPAQIDLMDKVWKPIARIAKDWLGLSIDPEALQIKNTIDISGLTDVDITPAVKVNEIRQAKGLPEDGTAKGNMYLGELGAEQKKGVYVKDSGNSKTSKTEEDDKPE